MNRDEKIKLAKNKRTSKKKLIELSKDEDWGVRSAVAKNPNTPLEVLIELSKDEDWDIRLHVAQNPNTPPEVLVELSKDKDWYMRSVVAEYANAPKEVLVELSKDRHFSVLNSLIHKRKKLPLEAWINLSDCADEDLKNKLLKRKELPDIVRLKLTEI